MDDDSRSSRPQSKEALLRANDKLESLVRHYQEQNKVLLDKYAELEKAVNNNLKEFQQRHEQEMSDRDDIMIELGLKRNEIGMLYDETRDLKAQLKNKSGKKETVLDSESEKSLEEEDDLDEEFTEVKKRRKRKSRRGAAKENAKIKKTENNQENQDSEDQMEANDLYDEYFPPMEQNKERKKTNVAQKSNNKDNKKESQRIPPVILRDKAQYSKLVAEFATKKISFDRATTLPEGVKIMPSTSQDFRAMTRTLDELKVEYHSYQLQEDKLLHIVLRGVLESFTENEISEDLKRQGFTPKKVVRFRYKTGRPMPMVLVLVPKEDKGIFNISDILYNSIKVEAQRTRTRSTQCYNCQLYGHSAFGCRAKPKCVKCAGDHSSKTCKITKEDNKAKCCNCGAASFGGCPKHPKNVNQQQQKAPSKKQFRWGSQENSKLAATPENMGAATQAIKLMNSAMEEFMRNLQKMQKQFTTAFMGNQE